jgi:hypothetical protein
MKELVECFIAWLKAEPSGNNAWKITCALAQETLKRIDSPDPEQREFDVVDIAMACNSNTARDHDSAKTWFARANVTKYLEARQTSLESFFRSNGHSSALRVSKRGSSGRHKANWFLEVYELKGEDTDPAAIQGTVANHPQDGLGVVAAASITYTVTRPPDIKLSFLGKIFLGRGEFVTRSGRGALWGALMFTSILPFVACVLLLFAMQTLKRPVQTDDLILIPGLVFVCWLYWRVVIRPWVLLIDDRIVLSGHHFASLKEDPVQLDMAKDDKHRYVRLVRYSAVCPICAGNVELKYGTSANKRRIFGCCSEVPQEHVFTFDRVTGMGQRFAR